MDSAEATRAVLTNGTDASRQLLDSIRPAVFKIEADDVTGTGWLVDANTIVTSYHVIQGQRNITAIGQDGKRYRLGKEVTFDYKNDVAILTFVGDPPNLGPPIERAPNSNLKPEDSLFTVGHPGGGTATYGTGKYRYHTTWKDWLSLEADSKPKFPRERMLREMAELTPELLARPLVVSTTDTTHGSSGGPITNSDGQVIAIVTQHSSANDLRYNVPVEKVNSIVGGRFDLSKFDRADGYYEPNLLTHLKRADHAPFSFMIDNIGLAAGVYGSSKLFGYTNDFMSLISRKGALTGGAFGAALLTYVSYNDADGLYRSTNHRDSIKYGLSLGADATIAGGLVSRYLSVLRSSGVDRTGKIGKALLLGGLAARVACELIPNNFVVDVGSKPVP